MNKLIQIVFFALHFSTFAQIENRAVSEKISDCDGAMNIYNAGQYNLQFTGKSGLFQDLASYPSLKNMKEINSLWCSFLAPYSGVFTFTAYSEWKGIDFIVFKTITDDICGDILTGTSEIEILLDTKIADTLGLRRTGGENYMYPITLKENEHIIIYFNNPKKKDKSKLNLNIQFTPLSVEVAEEKLKDVTDIRQDLDDPFLNIKIRDVDTGLPVSAKMNLKGTRSNDALYQGSDFYYTIEKSGKVEMNIDCEGYFSVDRVEPVSSHGEQEVVIWLEPLAKGKQLEMEGIQFKMGTSEILSSSEGKLRRLKDFLSLNSTVQVEIQGHVHAAENSTAAEILSTARAKRVYKFLIENGIDKDRLEFKGYGNSQMLYPKAQFSYEEQANRRVEIKIL